MLTVIEKADIGPKGKWRWRTDRLAELEVGQRALFRAEGVIEYASIRGSAYGHARANGRRYACNRVNPTTVCVRRLPDDHGRAA